MTATQTRDVASGVSYQGQNDMRVHFGLADRQRAQKLEIRWPSGLVESLTDLRGNQMVTVREGMGIVSATPFVR